MNKAIEHAMQGRTIGNALDEELTLMFEWIFIYIGVKTPPKQVFVLVEHIRKYYGHYYVNEVKLAYELVTQEVIPADLKLYGRQFNASTITGVLRSYAKYKKETCPELFEDALPTYSEREEHELNKASMYRMFIAYKFTGDSWQITGAFIRWLKELGITVPGSEGVPIPDPLEVVKQRIAGVKPESENDRAKDLVIDYFDSVNTLPL